jgi:hypothetical protein
MAGLYSDRGENIEMIRGSRCTWGCAAALVVSLGSHQAGRSLAAERPAAAAEKPVDFSRDVRPILATRCFSCHGEKQQESGFRLDRREAALRGGENGVDIVPGKSSKSNLVERISAVDATIRMPPEGQPLNTAAVSVIRHWIDQGATWPADPASVRPAGSEHWSLKPLKRPAGSRDRRASDHSARRVLPKRDRRLCGG